MNRVALVTGASRGIGRAIAAELAEAGHAVCINYLTHRQEAETLAEKIRNHGGNAIAVQADVADRAAVEAMVRTAEAELGPVSLLVNNAGIAGQIQFQDITDAQWNRYLGVNLGGLGTPIASLASLISYQFYSKAVHSRPGKYLGIFSAVNFGMLAILLAVGWLQLRSF